MTVKLNNGTVKVTLPSNYAENRTGAEVTLSYSLPEGTTWEQDLQAGAMVSAAAYRQAQLLQSGGVLASGAGDAGEKSSAVAPETTAEPKAGRSRRPPSEVIIGAASEKTPGTVGETAAITSAPPPASPTPSEQPSSLSQTEAPTPPAASLWGSPAVAPTAEPAAQEPSAQVVGTASPLSPATPGMALGSHPTQAGAIPGPGSNASADATVGTTALGMTTSPSSPTAPVTEAVASPSVAGETATVGGPVDTMTNADLTKGVMQQIARIEGLPGGKGKANAIMQRICHEYVAPPNTVFALQPHQRVLFMAKLAAVAGPVP